MSTLLAIVIRVLGVGAAGFLAGWLTSLSTGKDEGANIGAGLLAFLAFMVASGIWGFMDGRRGAAIGRTLLIWAIVAVVVGVVVVVGIQARGGDVDGAVLRSDLATVTPMVIGLVFVPAGVGAALGTLLAGRRGAGTQTRGRAS